MTKLFHKDKPIIGLDISQTGIKVMAIDIQKWLVLGYGSADLDPQKIQKSLDGGDDYLGDNIRGLLADKIVGALPSNQTVIGIPSNRSFSRTFSLPAKAEKNLADAIEVEVDQYIPIPLSSLYVDYEVIERTKEQVTAVMSAVPKALVDNVLAAAVKAELDPVMIEPGINAVARLLENTEEGHLSTLIVDIGPASTDIAVLDNSAIRISGGLGIGGNTFTLDIAKKLNVTLENAHQLKVLNGINAGPRQAQIVRALTPSPVVDARGRSYRHYYEEIHLLAYCLMPNHLHLLLYQYDNERSISSVMSSVFTAYTMYFNQKYARRGSLFENTYKAVSMTSDEQLLHITRYIHLNHPDFRTWNWSSYQDYLWPESKREWVDSSPILELFSSVQKYQEFVEDYEALQREREVLKKELAGS